MVDVSTNVFLISRGFRQLILEAYAPIRKKTGLGQMDLQIIFALYKNPCMTVGEIYRNTRFNRGQISTCVSRMIKKGYIEIFDRGNTRFDTYVLTKNGLEAAKIIETNAKNGRKKLFKNFTKEDIQAFQCYLDRILENVGEFDRAINSFKDELNR